MEGKNRTAVMEFFLLGLTGHLHQKIALFVLLLFVYLITLGGNLGMITLIWDRCTAICKPLLYTLIMSQRVCVQLVIGPYAIAIISTMTHTILTFSLPFCGPNIINHFFCDISPLLSLACVDTGITKLVLSTVAGAIGVLSGTIIMVSYVWITVAILKIQTAHGRWKAFSTCTSHLATVSVLFGTLFFIYVRPSSSSSLGINKMISLFYTVVIPGLNPLIYSLRNKEVKEAFKRQVKRKLSVLGG
uniref:G-protein coupled receptors family 1 profile domain-containing protein n=2 Tax=Chinchilla lanigera TaxID=34839 RepID=A0A8C2VEA4_CHILA